MNAYLICVDPAVVGGCAQVSHEDNERNQALTAHRGQEGSLWRDERWALDPTCQICGQRRGREEVGLFA